MTAILLGLSAAAAADSAPGDVGATPEADGSGQLGRVDLPPGPGAPEADPTPADSDRAASDDPARGHGKLGTAHLATAPLVREDLERRLAERGMAVGSPVMIRIFKAEAELELWMQVGERFELLTTYAICNWSGTLGPKLTEGDKQSPEGLYAISRRQLRHSARWRRSLDIGFPNTFDRLLKRTGSDVLLHGGCTSTGCYAMTDPVIEEIYLLSEAALSRGQKRIQVHAFPFRMTPENMAAHANSEWDGFWANLKEAYDLFERTRLPPEVSVCNNRYVVSEATAADDKDGDAKAGEGNCTTNISAAEARRSYRVRRRSARAAYAAARRQRVAARQRHAVQVATGHRRLPR